MFHRPVVNPCLLVFSILWTCLVPGSNTDTSSRRNLQLNSQAPPTKSITEPGDTTHESASSDSSSNEESDDDSSDDDGEDDKQ